MIDIKNKSNCCGCEACAQVCPHHCIDMKEDSEGFLYPSVNKEACVSCGLCLKVCPMTEVGDTREPSLVYAAKNLNESTQLHSSSGGVFSLIAEHVIEEGGVVFGARFNDQWEVVHDYTDNLQGLQCFRGSKYVQSRIDSSFTLAKSFLQSGRKVLFTGTACQISGLKKYLRKDYENLITLDVICHGVPSPLVWKSYLQQQTNLKDITSVKFRDKVSGWKNYSSNLYYQKSGNEEQIITLQPFMNLFLSNMILRPSCSSCLFKAGKCGSDITLGDFWGIDRVLPGFDDDKGVSAVLVYNKDVVKKLIASLDVNEVTYHDVLSSNSSLEIASIPHQNRAFYFYRLRKTASFQKAFNQLYSKNILMRIYRTLYRKFAL